LDIKVGNKIFHYFSETKVVLKLLGVQIITKNRLASKILVNSIIFLKGLFISCEKSEAKTKFLASNLPISFLITKTGM
jgi:hypothetical protein